MRYLEGVVSLALDQERCVGCGRCAEVCPHGVLAVEARKARLADRDLCIECGACARNCPVQALSVSVGCGCAIAVRNGVRTGVEDCSCGEGGSGCCGGGPTSS